MEYYVDKSKVIEYKLKVNFYQEIVDYIQNLSKNTINNNDKNS